MIFNLYSRVLLKVGDEQHVFDRSRLMFTEVAEIEKVTGLSYGEWTEELSRYSIKAVAALLHVLRKREGQPSDFGSLQFNVAEMDVIPIHEDGREFTPEEVAADLTRRIEEANVANGDGAVPTVATGAPVAPEPTPEGTAGISLSSPPSSGSGRGNGNGSRGRTSASARHTSTSS